MDSKKHKDKEALNFPVVAIGASAGGLDALNKFFSNVPAHCGIAFIVIQHLDPNYKGVMPELIQKTTQMKVTQATDNTRIKPDNVYVIPPNKNMSILNGRLHLFDIIEQHGLRLPINYFFNSLADDMGERSIGIILSGMGSDGCLGLQSIKTKSGLVIVQDPSTAKYDSMPRIAIEKVHPDIIASPEELPLRIISILKKTKLAYPDKLPEKKEINSIEKVILLVRSRTGHDFSKYKKSTFYRRVERRMLIHKIDRIASYVRFLQENLHEADVLFKELLIGTTSFFRDEEVWQYISENFLPSFLFTKPEGYVMRMWIPACSSGEEAFSWAIIFKETIESLGRPVNISLQIFATDLDNEAIEKARRGIFSVSILGTVSEKRIKRFFTKIGNTYRINSEIREMVVFAVQDVITNPPFTKIDILSCRNLLIYLEVEMQRKLISIFHYSLKQDGILVLGISETLGSHGGLFDPDNLKFRIFMKRPDDSVKIVFPTSIKDSKSHSNKNYTKVSSSENIQSVTDNLILQHYSPPGILVNNNGDVVYITRRAGKYIDPPVGKANMNIYAMLREGLSLEFPIAFRNALKTHEKVYLRNIKLESEDNGPLVDVIIQQLEKPDFLKGMLLIVFRDLPLRTEASKSGKRSSKDVHIRELEAEQQRLKDELQSTLEAMQVSEEELKSANEELQSTNEELQSTNEELTTSKEELQSMNEELQTVNIELVSKVDEFTEITNDMKNLLESTQIATLFLTKDFMIRRFTSGVSGIFKIIESDLGRSINDFASELLYDDFVTDMKKVLKSLLHIEKDILAKSGNWYSVKIMPYRTVDDRIDGLVLTFSDITKAKTLEAKLNETISGLLDSKKE